MLKDWFLCSMIRLCSYFQTLLNFLLFSGECVNFQTLRNFLLMAIHFFKISGLSEDYDSAISGAEYRVPLCCKSEKLSTRHLYLFLSSFKWYIAIAFNYMAIWDPVCKFVNKVLIFSKTIHWNFRIEHEHRRVFRA